MPVPQELLDILACPDCKTPVVLDAERLVCCKTECRRVYPIREDIPIMLIEESRALDRPEWEKIMSVHPAPRESDAR